MKPHLIHILLLVVLSSSANPAAEGHDAPRLRIVLAGDSTVTDDAGWGAGFAALLSNDIECVNLARSGRSSRSYRTEGWWQKCLELKPDVLLIQFGHNDQPGKGPKRESPAATDFRQHLRQYVEEARAIHCRPVLVTPLTRRRWSEQGSIEFTLAEYAEATSVVAKETNVPLLDLHRLSTEQCNLIWPDAYRAFEPMTRSGADHTHLNSAGGQLVGELVARELLRILSDGADLIDCRKLKSPATIEPESHSKTGLRLRQTENTITVSSRSDKAIVTYNKKSPPVPDKIDSAYHRSGFLHPVVTPAGQTVTATFPYDHPHQHGIFSAWVKTKWNDRDVDFWNLAGGTGRVAHQRVISTFSNEESTGFIVDLVHRTEQSPIVDVLRERWRVDVRPTDGHFHCFDLETTQTALTKLPLVVQKYHYGGIALRGPTRWLDPKIKQAAANQPEIREPSNFTNDRGSDRLQGNHEKTRWVTLAGTIDGSPVSITVLCHADNFRAPQSARLHPTRPYFCFAPCVTGEFVIDQASPFHARYRYLVTDDAPNKDWLEQQWQLWCNRNPH